MTPLTKILGFFAIIGGICSSAVAQITVEPIYSPGFIMSQNDIKFNPVVNRIANRGEESQDEDSVASQSSVADVQTKFSASRSRTQSNLRNFANKTRTANPESAAKMEQLFASTDIIGQIGDIMRTVGLRSDDVSHVYAVWWVSAWRATTGDDSADAATYAAVAEQARRGLASSPEFANANDAQKQEMAEALMIQAAMIDGMVEQYGSDPKMMKQVASAVRKGAAASGIDLDSMTLTPEGFASVGKKRSDAGDATQGEDKALAAADTAADDEGLGTTQLALIAAAGNAGLAGVFLFGKAMGKKG